MKKKLLIVLFAFVMVFSLAGCGSNDEVVNDGTDTTTTQEEKDMDDAGDSIKDGIEDTGDAIKNGADDVGDAIRDGADDIMDGRDDVNDNMNDNNNHNN